MAEEFLNITRLGDAEKVVLSIESKSDFAVIKVQDDFDKILVARVRQSLEQFIEHVDRNVILDLTGSEHIDSSGVGAIVYLFKRLRHSGFSLWLEGLHGQPLNLLNQLGINEILSVIKKT